MRLLIIFLGLFTAIQAQAQSFQLPKMDTVAISTVKVKEGKKGQLAIEMPYAKSAARQKPDLSSLVGKSIRKVQLIYTDYPKDASFERGS